MTKEEAVRRYIALQGTSKPLFLIDISNQLTVSARLHYEKDDIHAHQALMGINELQHHLSSEARHLIQGDLKRYPDDVLMRILTEKAAHYGISPYLVRALERGFTWREA